MLPLCLTAACVPRAPSPRSYALGEQNAWCKSTNLEIANHVPLLLRAPGMAVAGRASHALVELVDVFPTAVELAGLPPFVPPAQSPEPGRPAEPVLDGVSFASLLTDGASRCLRPADGASGDAARGGAESDCVKAAVFWQHSRVCATAYGMCGLQYDDLSRCDGDFPAGGCTVFYGHSVRTARWRYTLWVEYGRPTAYGRPAGRSTADGPPESPEAGAPLRPLWSREAAEEMYRVLGSPRAAHGEEDYDYSLDLDATVHGGGDGDYYDREWPAGDAGGGGRGADDFDAQELTDVLAPSAPRGEEAEEVEEARRTLKQLVWRHFAAAGAADGVSAAAVTPSRWLDPEAAPASAAPDRMVCSCPQPAAAPAAAIPLAAGPRGVGAGAGRSAATARPALATAVFGAALLCAGVCAWTWSWRGGLAVAPARSRRAAHAAGHMALSGPE